MSSENNITKVTARLGSWVHIAKLEVDLIVKTNFNSMNYTLFQRS